METTAAFEALRCTDCGGGFDPATAGYRCSACGGLLEATYDHGDQSVDAATIEGRAAVGPYRYAEFLPFPRDRAVHIDEGATPQVDCPDLADDIGVETVLVKDEGPNPTGGLVDRGLSLAVTAATQQGATDVALPTTGNGGQSAAAYAARAGLTSHSFVPTRTPFVNKAMVNVHGGDMRVVEGRYSDAVAAYEADAEASWTPVGPASPYRREGVKSLYFELAEFLDWTAPDAIVVPTGHGIAIAGIHAAIEDLDRAGLVDDRPRLYAAQPTGCAPVVEVWAGDDVVAPVEHPDTIVGPLEVAVPEAGDLAIDAIEATDGRGVAVDDEAILEAATDAASTTGVEVGATGGVAVAAARTLAEHGHLGPDDSVVLVNPVAGSKESDLLRSYLMGQGM